VVDSYLPADGELRRALALELALADLEYRRRAGEPASADDYLARYPQIRDVAGAGTELRTTEHPHRAGPKAVETIGTREPSGIGPPPSVSGYEILGELGGGGMGIVYKARQVAADRIVALKMMRTDGPADADLAARFRTEAEAAARLQHANIVQIFEVGAGGG